MIFGYELRKVKMKQLLLKIILVRGYVTIAVFVNISGSDNLRT